MHRTLSDDVGPRFPFAVSTTDISRRNQGTSPVQIIEEEKEKQNFSKISMTVRNVELLLSRLLFQLIYHVVYIQLFAHHDLK
jgi:hypothetical protein